MNAVDTNVLRYVHDPRDRDKQTTAAALLQSLTDGVFIGKPQISAIRI